jgi:hypothetical protein
MSILSSFRGSEHTHLKKLFPASKVFKYRRYKYEDFNEVVYDDNLSITLDMIALMSESEYAADIAYYLGKHPDETAAVSKMALPQAGAAIFAIEEKLIQNNFQVE